MRIRSQLSRRQLIIGAATAAIGSSAVNLFSLSPQQGGRQEPPTPAALNTPPEIEQLKPVGKTDEAYWKKIRAQFNLNDNLAFLNNGTFGPMSRFVVDIHKKYDQEMSLDPSNSFRNAELETARKRLAAFTNSSPDEIALTHSTTDGMNIFAHGLDWKSGDEVIISEHEHFGGYEAYKTLEKRFDIKIVWVKPPAPPKDIAQIIDAYENAITAKTKLLVVSNITFVTGLHNPIKELADLAHKKGALISVDGAQSFGMLPLDLAASGVDHYAGPGQKWLLAGTGTGFTYIKKELQDKVWPLYGYFDPEGRGANVHSARRYEKSGQVNIPAAVGIVSAVDLQAAIGKENIESRVRQLSSQLRAGLRNIPGVKSWTSEDPRFSAGITSFRIGDLAQDAVVKALFSKERIQVRSIKHAEVDGIRVSTHFYNTPDEVDHLLRVVRAAAEKPSSLLS